ncbi:MAG: ADP-ribosylglycohydrolase family protein [Candidatus Metalachnospira sp.]|nr:ADP-ribosylglycohydrolase family protein [Candidatus Metalachnospira sp.]
MVKKAWELSREKTDDAVPKILKDEEQTWEDSIDVGDAEDFHLRLLWNSNVPGSFAPESIMLAAIQAKENMGYIVSGGVELWEAGQDAYARNDMVALNQISSKLWYSVNSAQKDMQHPSWKFTRYESWEQLTTSVQFQEPSPVDKGSFYDKIYAGWMSQIIGGAIGTMIEGYTTDAIRQQLGEVRSYLRNVNTFNDDITYELAFLDAYKKKGKNITSQDVAEAWIGLIPSGWSAEEISLRNIRCGIMPPDSGRIGNPFGEWIGAQMRGAICGMIAPGNPKEAARLAWIDGEVSHFNNGIIGEVFNAMIVSLSFTMSDIRQIVESSVSMIPSDSEYFHIVSFALNACKEEQSWEKAWRRCEKRIERYNWIHAYPNAMAEVIALWFGNSDFDETAYIISMEGQDVDCNAAQILTAIGILHGMDKIRAEWSNPIGDSLQTYMRGKYRGLSIRSLAKETADTCLLND